LIHFGTRECYPLFSWIAQIFRSCRTGFPSAKIGTICGYA